jgi:sugar phosphate isomerase/epimerase
MTDMVLWEWNVKAHRWADQVTAAAAGGFDVLTLPYRKYLEALSGGLVPHELRETADHAGVKLDFLDGMSSWCRVRYPQGADAFLVAALDYSEDAALRVCEQLGMTRVTAIAGFMPGEVETGELIESFGRFAERASAAGLWVDLEPMPMMGLPTLASAWEIVAAVGASNTGVMLDTWHFVRGGADYELLRSIPAEKLVNVQLVDGYSDPRGETLWDDAMGSRLLPGEGELPLLEILGTLALGADRRLGSVGPEAIADELDTLAPATLGERASRATRDVLARAGVEL